MPVEVPGSSEGLAVTAWKDVDVFDALFAAELDSALFRLVHADPLEQSD
jgi:hypothetical protein